MPATQLTPLDTSFLAVESEAAHMHVGWVCEFSPPEDTGPPDFERLREHIGARLPRAPRYRQRLEQMPLELGAPVWVDDESFELDRHLRRVTGGDLIKVAADVMSEPLDRDRPLWEIVVVDGLEDGGLGVIGKAHHCMVDGIAAVELASLLLDPEPDPPEPPADRWSPEPAPPRPELLARGLLGGLGKRLRSLARPAGALASPQRLRELPGRASSLARAAIDTARPSEPAAALNERPLSPQRHLGVARRSLQELREIKRRFGVTINDVLLAAVSGALREHLGEDPPGRLKTMVPVNVRGSDENGAAGNRISFMFVDLPCEEPDPVLRLRRLAADTGERKERGLAAASETILDAIGQIPHLVRGSVSRLVSRPHFFNLTVSNIPGPPEPMYMGGCRLEAAYPVVPIPEQHTLSVGMTSIGDQACFGLYADRRSLPEVDAIAAGIDRELDELLTAPVAPR